MSLGDGILMVIDSTERGVLARPFHQFALGRHVDVLWRPRTISQQNAALARAYSQIGHPYNLFRANCEHFVWWVVTGTARSPQLRTYVTILALMGLSVCLYSIHAQS
jgi:hypothetical protein